MTTPLTAEELAVFLKSPGDAWEETTRTTDDWLNSIAATITTLQASLAERDAALAVVIDRLTTFVSAYHTATEEDNEHEVTRSVVQKITANFPAAVKSHVEMVTDLKCEQQSLVAALRGEQGMVFEDGYEVNVADLRDKLTTLTQSQRTAEWQPIETAPKDKTLFLVVCADRPYDVMLMRGDTMLMLRQPNKPKHLIAPIYTHWMPLPPSPIRSQLPEERKV